MDWSNTTGKGSPQPTTEVNCDFEQIDKILSNLRYSNSSYEFSNN